MQELAVPAASEGRRDHATSDGDLEMGGGVTRSAGGRNSQRTGALPVLDVLQVFGPSGNLLKQESRQDSQDSIVFDLIDPHAAFSPRERIWLLDPVTNLVADELTFRELPIYPTRYGVTLYPKPPAACPDPARCVPKTADRQELTAVFWGSLQQPTSAARIFFQSTPVPEPTTSLLLGAGLASLAARRRR